MNIFVCSPFRDQDPETQRHNVRIAKALCRRIALGGDIPFAPHLLYPQFLNEATERDIGIRCSTTFIEWWAEKLCWYPPVLTEGMAGEIVFAQKKAPQVRLEPLPLDFLNDADSVAYLAKLEEEDATDALKEEIYQIRVQALRDMAVYGKYVTKDGERISPICETPQA